MFFSPAVPWSHPVAQRVPECHWIESLWGQGGRDQSRNKNGVAIGDIREYVYIVFGHCYNAVHLSLYWVRSSVR